MTSNMAKVKQEIQEDHQDFEAAEERAEKKMIRAFKELEIGAVIEFFKKLADYHKKINKKKVSPIIETRELYFNSVGQEALNLSYNLETMKDPLKAAETIREASLYCLAISDGKKKNDVELSGMMFTKFLKAVNSVRDAKGVTIDGKLARVFCENLTTRRALSAIAVDLYNLSGRSDFVAKNLITSYTALGESRAELIKNNAKPCELPWIKSNIPTGLGSWKPKLKEIKIAPISQGNRIESVALMDIDTHTELMEFFNRPNKDVIADLMEEDARTEAVKFARSSLRRIEGKGYKGSKMLSSEIESRLGYTAAEFKAHITKHFKHGMSWENRDLWHIDHTIPLSQFIKSGIKDISIINHLDNLRPLWAIENLRKQAKPVTDKELRKFVKRVSNSPT